MGAYLVINLRLNFGATKPLVMALGTGGFNGRESRVANITKFPFPKSKTVKATKGKRDLKEEAPKLTSFLN